MTPRELADEIAYLMAWPLSSFSRIDLRDRIEAAIVAATAEAMSRAEEARRERDVASFGRDSWKSRAEVAEKALRDMIGADWEGKP